MDASNKLYVETPLIESICGINYENTKIYLKLENTQPSGSFKTRGISEHCRKLKERGCLHLVSSSGGNAGLAAAYSARKLKLPITVFVPTTTSNAVIEKLVKEGADVRVAGDVWDVANEHALNFVNSHQDEHAALVHPFNHAEIWTGHSSIVHELKEQVPVTPDAIVLSVGGGGLLCGVLEGLHAVNWENVPVIACETEGADCFNAAVDAGKVVTLPGITSIAKCLGSLSVVPEALEWMSKHKIVPVKFTDREAASACLQFANDHKMLVEPACGASLAILYANKLQKIVDQNSFKALKNIVIIVCGGHSVNMDTLQELKKAFEL